MQGKYVLILVLAAIKIMGDFILINFSTYLDCGRHGSVNYLASHHNKKSVYIGTKYFSQCQLF